MGTTPSISSVALPVIPSQFWDNINTLHPTAMKFINKNEKQDGGLYYAPNRVALQDSGGGYFASTQTSAVVTASQSSDLLPEQYNWVHVINDMLITYDQQVRQGESPYTKITALEAARYQAKQRHIVLLANGIINGNGANNTPYGLVVLVTPSSTYGGVVPGTDGDWVPQTITAGATLSGPSIVETMMDNCSWMGKKPTIGPTTRSLFSRCKAIWGAGLTYEIEAEEKGDREATMGIDKIYIKGGLGGGKTEIYFDDDIPASNLWLICDEVVHVKQSSLHFMDTHDPERPESGLDIIVAEVGYVLSSYITGAELRRVHGGWTALSA